jgi:EAL domain-containing protein (putative c-di-GMP-specific phosphodiesterase class I)
MLLKQEISERHSAQAQLVNIAFHDALTGLPNRLHRFPISALKIDRSFIKNMDISSSYAEIVRTIITLAYNLGIDVIAEGIETVVQLEQVKKLQCKYGQGYFFSHPATLSVANTLIHQESS